MLGKAGNVSYYFILLQKLDKNRLTVAVDGTLFKKHPKFRGYMEHTLQELIPHVKVKLMLSEDGSGRGAALCAAVTTRLDKENGGSQRTLIQ